MALLAIVLGSAHAGAEAQQQPNAAAAHSRPQATDVAEPVKQDAELAEPAKQDTDVAEPAKQDAAAKQDADVVKPVKQAPRIVHEFNFKYYLSPSAGLDRNDAKVGNVTIQRYSFDYQLRYMVSDGFYLMGGIYGNYMDLNADSSTLLPEKLQALGFMVATQKDLSDLLGSGWNTTGILRPLLTTASSSFSDPGVVVQGLWFFSYRQNEAMTWTAGVAFSTHADIGVLPVIGLRWDFAEDWSTFIGFPEASVSYKVRSDLTLRGLVTFQQGSYKVQNAPAPEMNDTYLDYREIRLGGGIDYQITKKVGVGLDSGVVLSRNFNYVDRDYKLKGDTAAYLNLTVNLRF